MDIMRQSNNTNDISCGHVRKWVMLSIILWTIYNVFIRFGSKLYRQTVGIPIVLLLLQICFCFVMRETSYCLCQTIIQLILLKLLFIAVPWGCLRFVTVVFPDHTDLLFLTPPPDI